MFGQMDGLDKEKVNMVMKLLKKIIFIIFIGVMIGCSNSIKQDNSKKIEKNKGETEMKFVVAPQYEGKTSDLIELGKKLVKEHPEAGKQGEITLYYTGSTYTLNQQEYVVFMLVNKTTTNIDHDAEFKLNWSYDGQSIYQNQLVEYSISENGKLPTQSATIFLLPLTKEQQSIVERITDGTKMSLSMSDLMMK